MLVCVNFIFLSFFLHIISHVESCQSVDHTDSNSYLHNVVILNLWNSTDECTKYFSSVPTSDVYYSFCDKIIVLVR
jgi:hypothetical protein